MYSAALCITLRERRGGGYASPARPHKVCTGKSRRQTSGKQQGCCTRCCETLHETPVLNKALTLPLNLLPLSSSPTFTTPTPLGIAHRASVVADSIACWAACKGKTRGRKLRCRQSTQRAWHANRGAQKKRERARNNLHNAHKLQFGGM